MKLTVTSLAALVAVSVFSTDASAQGAPPAPVPPPPPASDDNSAANTVADDVNTLNGQIVEVGEKNRYRRGYKKWNVAANPFGFLFQSYSLSASHAIGSNVAIRGELAFSTEDGNNALGLGAGVPIYFKKVYTGLFFEPGITSFSDGDEQIWAGPQLVFGYHWMWDSNLNLAIAAGIGRNFGDVDDTFPAGYFQLGYAFGD